MSQPSFDLYYRGELLDGYSVDSVRSAMAELFKTEAARIAPYFTGHPEVIKLNVAEPTVARYQAAMRDIGAQLIVVPAGQPAPTAKPAISNEPIDVDTTAFSLAQSGEPLLDTPSETAQVRVDVSNLSLSDSDAVPSNQTNKDTPAPPDTSHLSLK